MKIKGWKKLSNKFPENIIYQTRGPQSAEISIKRMYIPKTTIPMFWSVKIWKQGKLKPAIDKPFKTKKLAFTFAVKWMRLHPLGKQYDI